jgi:predicted translin family RNA/ssDNA-binding protein
MYQKDYILRMIEMLGELIAGILGLIKKGEFEKATEKLENLYLGLLKEDSAFFRDIPADELTDRLLHQHNYTNGHLEVLAELLNAEAELCSAQSNKTGSLEYSRRSLRLFEFIDAEYKTYSQDRLDKIAAIQNRIKMLEIT